MKGLESTASAGEYMSRHDQERLKSYRNLGNQFQDLAAEMYESGFRPGDPNVKESVSLAGQMLEYSRL